MSISGGSDSGPPGKDRYAALAVVLRERRAALGLSRKDLAAAVGLSYPYVAQLEGGYRAPSLTTAGRLADVLGLPVADLVDLADEAEHTAPPAVEMVMSSAPPPPDPSGRYYPNPAFLGASAGPSPGTMAARSMAAGSMADETAPPRRSRRRTVAASTAPGEAAAAHGTQPLPLRSRGDRESTTTSEDVSAVAEEIRSALSRLPAEQRLDALARAQRAVLDQLVADRVQSSLIKEQVGSPAAGTRPEPRSTP